MVDTILDLFAGIGCWSAGFERAGYRTAAACELDPWKRKWLAREFPEARLYDDVRHLTGAKLAADGIVPDIIVGSPPCKEYSSANSKGRGLAGDDLFLEFVRLVGECRPRWACAENSPNVRTRGFDRIARELEAAGYESRAYILGADDLGAPHIRKRAWIIANSKSFARPAEQPSSFDKYKKSSEREKRIGIGSSIRRDKRQIAEGACVRLGTSAEMASISANARGQRRRQVARGASGDEGADEGWPAPSDYVAGGEPASDTGDAAGEQVWRAGQPWEDDRCARGSACAEPNFCDANDPGEAARYGYDFGDADRGDGDARGQSLGGYARPELAALRRAIGPSGLAWSGGPGGRFDLVDGHLACCASPRARRLLDRELRRIAAAAGDAILEEIAYLMARTIRTASARLSESL